MGKQVLLKLIDQIDKWVEPLPKPADPLRLDRAKYKRRFWRSFAAAQPAALALTLLGSIFPLAWAFSLDNPAGENSFAFRVGFAFFWLLFEYALWSYEITRKVALYPDGVVDPSLKGLWRLVSRQFYSSIVDVGLWVAFALFFLFDRKMLAEEGLLSLGSAFNLTVIIGGTLLWLLHEAVPQQKASAQT